MPPPPAPVSIELSFQTVSVGGGPSVRQRRAADAGHVGLAGRVVDRERRGLAVRGAVVAGGGEHRLALRSPPARRALPSSEMTVEPDSASHESPRGGDDLGVPLSTMAV